MKDIYEIWKIPILHDDDDLFIEALHDDYEGFRIILSDKYDRKLRVSFSFKFTYRNTNEIFLLKLWDDFSKELKSNIFYKVKNSSYLKQFKEMTYDHHLISREITHYAIYTDQDCIDILSDEEPKIEWLGGSNEEF